MKKILLLFVILTLLMSSLTSCFLFIKNGNGNGNNNGSTDMSGTDGDQDNLADANLIWSSKINYSIVCDDETDDIGEFGYHLYTLVGRAPTMVTPDTAVGKHEIVIGRVNRPIASTAYKKLDSLVDIYSLEANGESAYIIYAEGGSLAVGYSDLIARNAALDYLTKNITEKEYSASGVVAVESFETELFVSNYRQTQREAAFTALESQFDKNVVDAFRNLYNLYDEQIYVWLANLYDPDTGGFYYSASARDNEGFLPDLESTVQALELLENAGLADARTGGYDATLSEETMSQLTAFVTGLQANDGYFYHPQWGTAISSSRRGRDLGWATRFFHATGVVPKYDSPTGGFRGENRIGASVASAVTARLGSRSIASAVSGVALASSVYNTEETFKLYLDGLFASGDSYNAAHILNSTSGEIKKAGRWDYLLNYLRDKQNKTNGLWEDTVSYNSINGLMKLSTFFGNNFPNADKAIESVLEIISLDVSEDVYTICYVYNPWVCLDEILPSCSQESRAKFDKILRDRALELITKTTDKLAAFRRDDGGFSYYQDSTTSISQGVLVAIKGTVESDVNSTAIAISTVIKNLFGVYDAAPPPIYSKYDTIYFLDIMDGLGTIIKSSQGVTDPEVITFDNYDETTGEDHNGVVTYPADAVANNVGDKELGEDGNYKWFTSQIVPNPDPDAAEGDMVLYAADFTDPDHTMKTCAATGSNTEFSITNLGIVGECYIFDADLYFAGSDGSTAPIMQLICARVGTNSQNSVTLNVYTYQRYGQTFIRIGEGYAGADGIKTEEIVGGIPTGEWFNLRIEVYKEYGETNNELSVKIKLYLDGNYVGYSDSSHYDDENERYYDNDIGSFKLAYYRTGASAFYIDNVYVAKSSKKYVPDTVQDSGSAELDESKTVYDFETGIISNDDFFIEQFYKDADLGKFVSIDPVNWTAELESKYGIGTNKGGVRFYGATDPTNSANKVLRVFTQNLDNNSGNGTMYIDNSTLSAEGNTYEVCFDYYFDPIDFIWRANEFTLEFQNAAGTKLFGFAFDAKEIPETHSGASEMVIKTNDGTVIDNLTLKSGQWYSMKFEYYYNAEDVTQSRAKIYLRDSAGNYACVYDEIVIGASGAVSQLGIRFSAYKIRGNQYFDNISFAKIDKEYSAQSVVNGDDVKISGILSGAEEDNPDNGNTNGTPDNSDSSSGDMDDSWAENTVYNTAYIPTSLTISFYDISKLTYGFTYTRGSRAILRSL